MDRSFTLGSTEEADNVKILQSRNGLLPCGGSGMPIFDYIYNSSTNKDKNIPYPDYLLDNSPYYSRLKIAFDHTKSLYYKLVDAGRTFCDIDIQIYSSEKGKRSLCRDRFNYFSFDHFYSAIYWNDGLHWLETENRQLMHYSLNFKDPDHPIIQPYQSLNGNDFPQVLWLYVSNANTHTKSLTLVYHKKFFSTWVDLDPGLALEAFFAPKYNQSYKYPQSLTLRRRVLIHEMEDLRERGGGVDSFESLKPTHARETTKLADLTDVIAESLADIHEKERHRCPVPIQPRTRWYQLVLSLRSLVERVFDLGFQNRSYYSSRILFTGVSIHRALFIVIVLLICELLFIGPKEKNIYFLFFELLFMALGDIDRDAEYAFSKLLQMGTVSEYQNEFEMLTKRVTITESLPKSFYISRLKLDIQCLLLRSNLKILDEAFSLARAVETRFTNLDIWEFLRLNPSTLGEDFFKARIIEAYFGSIEKKEQNIPEKEDTTLSLLTEEVSLVVEWPLDASKDTILSSALNVAPLEVVFARPDDEESTSGKTIVDESVGIKQNEPMDFNEGKSLNLVVVANDVGNNGFSTMDHQWQGDLFAIGGAAQVDTWNHNRSHPINTFEWGSGSVRCNLGEPNILATYGNDMGITNYSLRLKDEVIKKLKERTQVSKKHLKIRDLGIRIVLRQHLEGKRKLLVSKPTTFGDVFSLVQTIDACFDDQATPVAGTSAGLEANKVVNDGDDSESSSSELETRVLVDGKQDEAKVMDVADEQNNNELDVLEVYFFDQTPHAMVLVDHTGRKLCRRQWMGTTEQLIEELESKYDNAPNMFSIRIHHGGNFLSYPGRMYVSGRVDIFDMVDMDLFTVVALNMMVLKLGYTSEPEPMFYNYLRLLTSLDVGPYALACEEDVRCLATLVRSFKLIEVYIEHGVTVLDSYLRSPRFRAILEDITNEPAGSIIANRTEKMLLLTWHGSSETTKESVCDSITPSSLPHDSSTLFKDSVCESITPRCMSDCILTPPTDESVITYTQLNVAHGVDTQSHVLPTIQSQFSDINLSFVSQQATASQVIHDVTRQLSFDETELYGEAGFADVAESSVNSSGLSHDESFGVYDLDLNLNKPVNLNVSQVETQSKLLVFEELDAGPTREPILAKVSTQEPIVAK
nr:hypothetical protein [Tanacetum cinerariifolium]